MSKKKRKLITKKPPVKLDKANIDASLLDSVSSKYYRIVIDNIIGEIARRSSGMEHQSEHSDKLLYETLNDALILLTEHPLNAMDK